MKNLITIITVLASASIACSQESKDFSQYEYKFIAGGKLYRPLYHKSGSVMLEGLNTDSTVVKIKDLPDGPKDMFYKWKREEFSSLDRDERKRRLEIMKKTPTWEYMHSREYKMGFDPSRGDYLREKARGRYKDKVVPKFGS